MTIINERNTIIITSSRGGGGTTASAASMSLVCDDSTKAACLDFHHCVPREGEFLRTGVPCTTQSRTHCTGDLRPHKQTTRRDTHRRNIRQSRGVY
eukprot:2717052-Heterocapsa_arctica.AAC.1